MTKLVLTCGALFGIAGNLPRNILLCILKIFSISAISTIVCLAISCHTIDEGNVGVYFVKGRLEESYSTPGVNWLNPFVTEVQEVTVRYE